MYEEVDDVDDLVWCYEHPGDDLCRRDRDHDDSDEYEYFLHYCNWVDPLDPKCDVDEGGDDP